MPMLSPRFPVEPTWIVYCPKKVLASSLLRRLRLSVGVIRPSLSASPSATFSTSWIPPRALTEPAMGRWASSLRKSLPENRADDADDVLEAKGAEILETEDAEISETEDAEISEAEEASASAPCPRVKHTSIICGISISSDSIIPLRGAVSGNTSSIYGMNLMSLFWAAFM